MTPDAGVALDEQPSTDSDTATVGGTSGHARVSRDRVRVDADRSGDTSRAWWVAVAIAAVAFACATVVVITAPDWASGATGATLGRFQFAAVAVGLLAGLAGVIATLRVGRKDQPVGDAFPVEAATAPPVDGSVAVPGARLDAAVAAGANDDERSRERVRESLRGLAIRILVRRSGCSRDTAATMLASGEWTDDPRAAAFLGDSTVGLPLTTRIADWARGHSFRRRVDATVAELRRRWEGEP